MLKISILKVDNPSCLWGRVIRGPGGDAETAVQYDTLLAQMNLFYHDVTQDLRKLKPTSLDEGQVCVVYWSVMKSWCRAVVESIIVDSVSCQARCLLVDHGERLVVPSDQIRVAMQNFLQLPFWVRRFHLAGLKPATLRVSVFEKMAELIPSSQWDSSATLYLHNLLQASTRTEAVLLESESDSTSIELYLTVGNVKICVNDDLVVKKFAFYIRESADGAQLNEVDRCPVMLSSSVLNQLSPSRTLCTAAHTQPAAGEHTDRHTLQHGKEGGAKGLVYSSVMSHAVAAGGAADWLAAPLSHQRKPEATCEDRTNVPDQQLPSSSQSKNGSEAASAAESDSSDETDSSLAAALTTNLSLFRFLKFLNPQQAAPAVSRPEETAAARPGEEGHASTAAPTSQSNPSHGREALTQHEEASCLSVSGRGGGGGGAAGVSESRGVEEETSGSSSPGSDAADETWRSDEERVCSRLLEWLNPEPLNSDPDAADKEQVRFDPRRRGILVHSVLPVEPCSGLDDAPLTDALRWVLQRKRCGAPSPADRYSWPAVARGCNTLIVSPDADQPLSYLGPLLTHILLNSIFSSLTSSAGPVAVLLCPGWEKVQAVYDLLEETRVAHTLHPFVVLLGVGKDEAKTVRIPKNCLLLVTTPFSLVRLLSCHCFLFLRLYHLVLDEADQLFALAPEQMATILQHFQKVTSSEQTASCPQQLVAVAKRWTSHMEGLLANHMPNPCMVLTVPEEAALYGDVQQIILMTLESSKIAVLLGSLDFNPDVGQKTLIVANSAQEVEDVFKAVANKSAFCLMTHEGLTHNFDFVIQQWRKDIGPGTHLILVTTNECLKCFGIRDATCVVHFSFPTSPKVFGSRLFCMAENFRNLSGGISSLDHSERSPSLRKSVLLISERNARHVVGLLRYLTRTNAPLPSELRSFAQGVHTAREDQKSSRPLCRHIKSFGLCRDGSACPDRHRFIPGLDRSVLPASGVVEVVPLYIKTASLFYGCIIRKEEAGFHSLLSEMTSYYTEQKVGAKQLLEGELYAVQEDELFYRVKILSVPDKGERLFFSVLVEFIDVGKEEEVKSHQILQLPEHFHSLPAQAVELVLCRVKPVDQETEWHPKVTRAISQKIRGHQHRARAVFSFGNTVFMDPMVRVSQVPGVKVVINEYNVQSEILKTGMGVSNPEHLHLLKALWQESEADGCKEAGNTSGSTGGPASLEFRIKAEEEVLAEAFRAAEVSWLRDPPQLDRCEPLGPESPGIPPFVPAPTEADLKSAEQMMRSGRGLSPKIKDYPDFIHRITDGPESCPPTSQAAGVNPGDSQSSSQQVVIANETDRHDAAQSFHPQVRWYQTSDSVIVTVKLMNPENQSCSFRPERVVYSGRVNGRTYRAALELQANISADLCCWEMKYNEPVLKLVKQQKGLWEKLLKNKNIFVSYDMEHFEEDEDRIPNGVWFEENTGEDHCYLNAESDSDSD